MSVTATLPAKNTMWTNNSENTQYKPLCTQDFTESTVTAGASAKVPRETSPWHDALCAVVCELWRICNLVRVSSLSSLLFSISCFTVDPAQVSRYLKYIYTYGGCFRQCVGVYSRMRACPRIGFACACAWATKSEHRMFFSLSACGKNTTEE